MDAEGPVHAADSTETPKRSGGGPSEEPLSRPSVEAKLRSYSPQTTRKPVFPVRLMGE